LHQCIRPLLGAHCAPDHHRYQRACDLISGQASTRGIWVTSVRMRQEDRFSIVVSSSRRPRRVDYIIDSSSFHGCSFVRAWRRFLRPGLRVQTGRAQGVVKAGRRAGLPLASMLPGHALTEAQQVLHARMQLASNKRIASYTRRFRRQEEIQTLSQALRIAGMPE